MRRPPPKLGGTKNRIPPYVPYGTFRTFIKRLGGNVPKRIDRSLMPFISGTIQSQLMATLRYLGMMHQDGQATDQLARLLKAGALESRKVLKEIVTSSYADLFSDLDLTRARAWQIEEKFKEVGASGETLRKCVAFFVAAAKEAGLEVSPYVKPFAGVRARGRGTRRAARAEEPVVSVPGEDHPPTWQESLLLKFPSFDPAWSEDVKAKWFDGFEKLTKILEGGALGRTKTEGT